MEPIVIMKGINKEFPNVKAVDNGYFDLYKGEIHSLIGENGAGKSTMMKMLYGLYPKDSGTIMVKGSECLNHNPYKAIDLGIGMVHQEFMVVNELSVLENIILGFEPKKSMDRIDFTKSKEIIQKYIDVYNLDVQPNKIIKNISVGETQRVEIIKALYRGAEILILDEPTAVLTPQETTKLFDILRSMKKDGKTIVFISHKLNEVMEISDRITVMKQGKYVNTVNKADTSPKELARMMVGRDILLDTKKVKTKVGERIFEAKDLYIAGERRLSTIKGVSFHIDRGEILGVAGVDGNGQSELIEAITGLRPVQQGTITLKGKDITNLSAREIRERGISHIPEDRNVRGLNKEFTIFDNLIAACIDKPLFRKFGRLIRGNINSFGEKLISKYDIRPNNGKALTGGLSGGNAQKVVVAREVEMASDLLIASQPTRGVDIGAIESIRNILNEVKAKGTSVLLVSADLDEILSLSDRIIVMHEGKISGELDGSNVDINELGMLMTGGNIGNEAV